IISPNPITGKITLNEEDDFIMEDGKRETVIPPAEHARLLSEGYHQRRLTQWADSTLLPTQHGSYNPDKDLIPWIGSDIYLDWMYDNPSVTEEPNPGPIPAFMEGWLTFADEWPITGVRDDSDPNTGFRTQKNPHYASLADLAPHQIPVNVVALTNRRDLKFGPKMNPYRSERREYDYYKLCEDVSAHASRYEQGDIGYAMYDVCHALLYVEDFSIAMNEHLQKRGEMVEFVLMEMSIHQHEECWAPWDAGACRNSMANNVDFAKDGMINVFVADGEEPFYMKSKGNPLYQDFSLDTGFIRGQTILGPQTWRDAQFGSHLYVDGGTGRGMQIATHEFQHTLGISHVAGSPGSEYEVTDQRDDSAIIYSALSHPTCEMNAIGLWYCSDKYIFASPPQCDESERCCGTRSESDLDNYLYDSENGNCMAPWPLPSAYTPTYAEPFTQIIDNYLHLNNVIPASVDGPDGSCAGHWDEYSCWAQEGCLWDQTPAVCIDIEGWPDFPAKPHLTVSSQAAVYPQFGDTKYAHWLDPMQNLHTYVAEAGDTIEVSIDAGTCTYDVCSRCAGHPPACEKQNHGTVDMWIEVLDQDMNREGLYSVGNGHHTFNEAGLHYIKIFVKTRRNDKPITHDYDMSAYDDPDMMCDKFEEDDWMNTRNCWENDFGTPYTLTIYDGDNGPDYEGTACEGADSCEVYVDPGTLNGMCVDYSPPSPGCPEQFEKENPGVKQPNKNMDPACWRGKCLNEYSFANDYGYCSDMTTFKWCVHWFCGNGYSEYLEDMPDFQAMEKCLCNPEDTSNSYRSGDCADFNDFPNTGRFEQLAFGGSEVYYPVGEPISQGGSGSWFKCSGDAAECAYLGPMLGWFEGSEPGCGWISDDPEPECMDWDNSPPDTSCDTAADCASLKVEGGCDYVCANPDSLNRGPGQCMWVEECPDYAASVPDCNEEDCGGEQEPCQDRECCTNEDALASCGTSGDICESGWCEWSSDEAQKQCEDNGMGCSGTEPFGGEGEEMTSNEDATAKAAEALLALTDSISENEFDVEEGMQKFVERAVSNGEIGGDVSAILEDVIETVGQVEGKDSGTITIGELDLSEPEEVSKVACTSDRDCDAGFKCMFPSENERKLVTRREGLRRRLFGDMGRLGECQWQGD
ncbi:hypothetical protein TrRE_jg12135, partial [Triparma retinervis]